MNFWTHSLIDFNKLFVPSISQTIACAIAIGVLVHAGSHLSCDFILLTNASPEKFALIASDFSHGKRPTYSELLIGVLGVTGISMVIFMAIAFILATSHFRQNVLRLPAPFNKIDRLQCILVFSSSSWSCLHFASNPWNILVLGPQVVSKIGKNLRS